MGFRLPGWDCVVVCEQEAGIAISLWLKEDADAKWWRARGLAGGDKIKAIGWTFETQKDRERESERVFAPI